MYVESSDGNGRHQIEINWALIINMVLLTVVILGAWFTTFSGPLNEKFVAMADSNRAAIKALSDRMDAQFDAHEKTINHESAIAEKFRDQMRASIKEIRDETESRRVEIISKTEINNLLNTNRLEFVSEIKRLDQQLIKMISRDEVLSVWKIRDEMVKDLQRQLSELMKFLHDLERERERQVPILGNGNNKKPNS